MSKSLLLILLLAVGTMSYNNGRNWLRESCQVDGHCTENYAPLKICDDYELCYRCGQNQVYNQETRYCDCKAGTYKINGICAVCPEGYTYNALWHMCEGINPCGINQHLVGGVCKCLPGLVVIQNICQRCPINQTYFPSYDACRCSIGYSLVNGTCILIDCVTNQVYDADKQACVCKQGYYEVATISSSIDAAGIVVNVTTIQCKQCAMNEVYNPATRTCDPFIPPTCGRHQYFYENCCFCEIGYVRIGGVCLTCPRHSSYDWNTDSCICDPGYYFVGEEVKQIPYQYYDTGSSFTSNPSRHYSYKAPSSGIPIHQPAIIIGSNYDHSGINTNRANFNTYSPPPINS